MSDAEDKQSNEQIILMTVQEITNQYADLMVRFDDITEKITSMEKSISDINTKLIEIDKKNIIKRLFKL